MSIKAIINNSVVERAFNAGLRLASLGLKLLLTLYMGKYLGLTEMGTYGLVAAYAAISIPLLGFRLDYVVMREIVNRKDLALATLLRDEMAFYISTYAIASAAVIAYLYSVGSEQDQEIILIALVICTLESFATITSQNMSSLKRPIFGNFLFFIRSSLWAIPVMVLGWYNPEYRTAQFVFDFWIAGIMLSLMVQAYAWRKLPWREALRIPVQWGWIWTSVKRTLPIWIGGVCGALSGNVDRFIIETYLGREFVGLVSFYGSFVLAVGSLIASGLFSFKYPYLIEYHKSGDLSAFQQLTRKLIVEGSLTAAVLCICIGIAIPWLGTHFDQPEFARQAPTLWLMLGAMWLKTSTEGLYFVQYARHQDRDIWIGNIAMLVMVLGFNFMFVPQLGFIGIGYSAVMCALALGAWRIYSVRNFKPSEAAG